jgi:AAA+ superfamily predicted ATPase
MKKVKSSIDVAAERMVELDAAGWGLIILRADRESDIRRTVAKYPHLYEPEFKTKGAPKYKTDNIQESIGGGLIKDFFSPLDYPSINDGSEESPLRTWFVAGLKGCNKLKHRLLYVSDLCELVGSESDSGNVRNLEQTQNLYLIKALCEEKRKGLTHSVIVVGSRTGRVCKELTEYAYVIDIGAPEKEEIDEIIWQSCVDCGGERHGLEPARANELAEISRGMRQDDIRSVISLAYAQHEFPLVDGAQKLFSAVLDAKRQLIAGVRGLRWIDNRDAAEIGGMQEVRQWLEKRSAAFNYTYAAKHFKVAPPKGALLAGLPGCGKTLFAKFASHLLSDGRANRTPVLQMDLSAMLGKWLGEAESNFAHALRMIESVAPCVVIVDEIEKFFGGISEGGNEASRHIFASLLEWMQSDREKAVLVIATANKVDSLPPELKRKGRFDETFFVGIPMRADCRQIMSIHLHRKAKVLSSDFDYDFVMDSFLDAAAREGRFFNGADIESIVNAAFCSLFSQVDVKSLESVQRGGEISDADRYSSSMVKSALLEELKRTRSYFDNNMDETASYWTLMRRLNFRNAGGEDLFKGIKYDEESGKFSFGCVSSENYASDLDAKFVESANRGDYDDALRYKLASRVYAHVQKTKEGGARCH